MTTHHSGRRKLIAKEIELGFLRVPSELKKVFPQTSGRIEIVVDGKEMELNYNPKYGRITGLTQFFREHEATPNDITIVEVADRGFVLTFERVDQQTKQEAKLSEAEAAEILDLSEVPSSVKGKIVEERVAELIQLYGQGLLNVYRPLADVEGIDLIVVKNGVFQPLFIQVKSRFNLRGKNFQIGVRVKTFVPHHAFFVAGVFFDPVKMDIADHLIFLPTDEFKELANEVRKDTKDALLVLNTRLDPSSHGRFAQYIVRKDNLVNKLFEKFSEIEKYMK